MEYLYIKDGITLGPVSLKVLMVNVTEETMVNAIGSPIGWLPLKSSPFLMERFKKVQSRENSSQIPPIPSQSLKTPPPLPQKTSPKEKNTESSNLSTTKSNSEPRINSTSAEPYDNAPIAKNPISPSNGQLNNKDGGLGCGWITILLIILAISAAYYFFFYEDSSSTYYNENRYVPRDASSENEQYQDNSESKSSDDNIYKEPEPTYQQCIKCEGTGWIKVPCGWCEGTGRNSSDTGSCSMGTDDGSGYLSKKCPACDGEKRVRTN